MDEKLCFGPGRSPHRGIMVKMGESCPICGRTLIGDKTGVQASFVVALSATDRAWLQWYRQQKSNERISAGVARRTNMTKDKDEAEQRLYDEAAAKGRALDKEKGRSQGSLRSSGFSTYPAQPPTDWHRLDSKDKSAVLREQGEVNLHTGRLYGTVETGPMRECESGLIELRRYLKDMAVPDEYKANQEYKDTAKKFANLNLPVWASAVTHIASDEAEHAAILNIIIDVITEKCGK